MGAAPAHGVERRRSKPRAWLALARVSNLPTVWTNVLAALVLARHAPSWPLFVAVAAAVSLLYCGGMFLNDAFDRHVDAVARPERPIPAHEASARAVFAAGFALLALGPLLLGAAGGGAAAVWGAALAACIIYYDWRHKRDPAGPFVMGVCRGLVYVSAAAAAGAITGVVAIWAAAMAAYVTALSVAAKNGDRHWGPRIAWLIAGISIVDAIAIATAGRPDIAVAAAMGCPLTLLAQRWVRGT